MGVLMLYHPLAVPLQLLLQQERCLQQLVLQPVVVLVPLSWLWLDLHLAAAVMHLAAPTVWALCALLAFSSHATVSR